jgi:anti-anti-sigma regulatory factor
MRLNLDSSLVGSSASLLVVAGIIDWTTIAEFRAALSRLLSRSRPDILVDLTGLLSWSAEGQEVVERAAGQALLCGGRLVFFGLAPIPAWEAGGCDLQALERTLLHVAAKPVAADLSNPVLTQSAS